MPLPRLLVRGICIRAAHVDVDTARLNSSFLKCIMQGHGPSSPLGYFSPLLFYFSPMVATVLEETVNEGGCGLLLLHTPLSRALYPCGPSLLKATRQTSVKVSLSGGTVNRRPHSIDLRATCPDWRNVHTLYCRRSPHPPVEWESIPHPPR